MFDQTGQKRVLSKYFYILSFVRFLKIINGVANQKGLRAPELLDYTN